MSEAVTVQITRQVAPEATDAVEGWVARGQAMLSGFPGYLGSGWVRSSSDSETWHMLLRFDDDAHLQGWAESAQRRAWMEEFHEHVRSTHHIRRTGIEGWFDDPRTQETEPFTPPRWKQMVVIFTGFFPVSLTANLLVSWALPFLPFVLKAMAVICLATPTMVYVVLPFVTRLYEPWTSKPPRNRRSNRSGAPRP